MAKAADDTQEQEPEVITYESLFAAYSKFGIDDDNDAGGILLSQADQWMKQAKIIGEKITLTDTGMTFNKFRKRRLSYEEFEQYLIYLCELKNLKLKEIKEKLFNAGNPTLAPKIT